MAVRGPLRGYSDRGHWGQAGRCIISVAYMAGLFFVLTSVIIGVL